MIRDVLKVLAWIAAVAIAWTIVVWALLGAATCVYAREFCWDTSAGAEVYRLYVAPVPLESVFDPDSGMTYRTTTPPVFDADDRLSFMASCCQPEYCCVQVTPEPPDELVYYFATADTLFGGAESDVEMRERLVAP